VATLPEVVMNKRTLLAYVLIAAFLVFWALVVFAGLMDRLPGGAAIAVGLVAFVLLAVGIVFLAMDKGLYDRGVPAFLLAALLLIFYLSLYYTDHFTKLVHLVWPGGDKWTFYGLLYTVAVLGGGLHFIKKNRRSRYQVIRTSVIIFVQVTFAFAIPTLMRIFTGKDYYFSYLWPLKIEYFYPHVIFNYPLPLVLYSFLASLIAMPLLAYFFGKRWYCSWVCGCGGLANTFGDPWRHLSSKKRVAWKFETVSIHLVLLFAVTATAIMLINWGVGKDHPTFSQIAWKVQGAYGFFIATLLSGMAGVFLYPVMGTRVWCRFFCPMAAVLGLIQKFGRFRISVNGELCMACGNCSKYCEMGIDVRQYAMRGEDFKRASCVGCGMCEHVCPRGVLRLHNGKPGEEKLI
jgi:ferredoxin-type protein NapH